MHEAVRPDSERPDLPGDAEHDPELLRRFQIGDAAAFRTLFERHLAALAVRAERRLPRLLHRRVGVLDVLQEVSLAAYCQRAGFEDRGPAGFRRWVFGILDNKIRELVRFHAHTKRRALHREVNHTSAADEVPGSWGSLLDQLLAGERRQQVAEAFASLPPDYQTVIRLRRGEGLSVLETAARMVRTPAAVKKLFGRALSTLQRLLEERGQGGQER